MQELREFYYWKHRDAVKQYLLDIVDRHILDDSYLGKDGSWGKDARSAIEDAFDLLEEEFEEKRPQKRQSAK